MGIYFILRFQIAGYWKLTSTTVKIGRIDFWDRVITFPQSFVYYLKTFLLPINLTLNETWVVQAIDFESFYSPIILILIFLIILFGLYKLTPNNFKRHQIFLLTIFVLGTGLHSNILITLDATVANRWFYLQSFALITYISLATSQFIVNLVPNKIFIGMVTSAILISCWLSFTRASEWNSRLKFYTIEVLRNPDDSNFNNALGSEYYQLGDLITAEKYFRKSVELDPKSWANWNNLGIIEEIRGNLIEAENSYARSINNGQFPAAMENYFRLLLK